MGQDLTSFLPAPHHVQGLFHANESPRLTDSRLLQHQAFSKGPVIQVGTCSTLHLATFLPETEEELTANGC